MSCPDIRLRRLGLTAAAALAAVAVTGVAAAQSIVVRSTGPSASKYPAGTKLKASDRVVLVDGDKVVLMQGGKTRTLTGKGSFVAGATVQASQSVGSNVTRMLAKSPSQSRAGASRGPGEEEPMMVRATNLWLLDYREGGNFCVADPATLLLWRPDMTSDTALTIAKGEQSATVALVAGAQFRKWPIDTLPIEYGVDYQMSGGGLAAPVTVRFSAIAAMPETPDAASEMLMAKGCTPQLDRLVDTMTETESADG